mgnify:CR=1 FL=1
MVGRDIEQNGDTRMQLARRGDLIARKLGDEPLPLNAAIDIVDADVADIAHRDARQARCAQELVGERRHRRLPVGTGDGAPAFGR